MKIKTSVLNTFSRMAFDYEEYIDQPDVLIRNRFTGEVVKTSALIGTLIEWVYKTSNDYEDGVYEVNLSDFDRIRMFILEVDPKAYSTCID